jgi:hypothetical protein
MTRFPRARAHSMLCLVRRAARDEVRDEAGAVRVRSEAG